MKRSPSSIKTVFAALLAHHPLFEAIPASELQPYINQAAFKQYNKKHLLFVHNDNAQSFYIVKHGWVKLFRETLDGDEAVVDILTHGQMFGDNAMFGDGCYPYSAEVVEDAEIYELPLSLLKEHITTNNRLALNMLNTASYFRKKQTRELEHMKIQNAPQRISCFLLQLYKPGKNGTIHIHLPYDKVLIAARLGMQPETFSRALLKLQQETGIRIKGATVEIDDISGLMYYSCKACSSSYPCEG